MKIIINISNLVMGGAIQIANSFLNELKKLNYQSNEYLIFYNSSSIGDLEIKKFPDKFKFKKLKKSPANIYSRSKILKILFDYEKKFNPDIVFTLFGPSYWIPKSKHICGFADGWVYNPNSIVYSRLNFLSRIKRMLLNKYKIYRLKKESTHFILETEDAKNKFSNCLNLSSSNISVVSNTYNSVFDKKIVIKKVPKIFDNNSFKLLTISSYYPNKNLEIINEVVKFIPNYCNVKFYVTLPDKIFKKLFYKSDRIINLGVQFISNCPKLYYFCNVMFLPTLLETFTASYPEAMIMNRPILTSNYSFSKDICNSAAEYFDPLNPKDIAKKIINLINDKKRYEELCKLGRKRVLNFPNCEERAKQYIDICYKQINK